MDKLRKILVIVLILGIIFGATGSPAMQAQRAGTAKADAAAQTSGEEALLEIAPRYNASAAQVALNWLIHAQGDLVVTIPGATKVCQAVEAAAMRFKLAEGDLQRLDEVNQPGVAGVTGLVRSD